jgi:hypothetical protein
MNEDAPAVAGAPPKEPTMNCYECAINGKTVPAVATCTHCGIGICLEHFRPNRTTESAAPPTDAVTT